MALKHVFVSDLFRNPEDRFFHKAAHTILKENLKDCKIIYLQDVNQLTQHELSNFLFGKHSCNVFRKTDNLCI